MSSKIPSDLLVPRGLNGLIDTYPDLNYGLGVLEKRHLVDSGEQTAGLPDGLQKESDLLLGDLSSFMGEEQHSDMLFIDVEPDPEIQALPEFEQPISEIEDAWSNREQPAVYAEFQKELIAPVQSVSKEVSEELLEEALFKAARMLVKGFSDGEIQRLVKASLQGSENSLQEELNWLKGQRGLLGNVYLIANAYPNLQKGAWREDIKRHAPNAQYLVVDTDTDMGRKLAAQDRFMGMDVVEEINWKKAFQHYLPRLKSLGCRVATTGDYETRLQQAFLNAPKRKANLGTRPTQVMPSETVSLSEARDQLTQATNERVAYSQSSRDQASLLKRAAKQAIQSFRAGILSKKELRNLVATKDPDLILKTLREKKEVVATSQDYSQAQMTEHRSVVSRSREFANVQAEADRRRESRRETLQAHQFTSTSEYTGVGNESAHYANHSKSQNIEAAQVRIQERRVAQHKEQVSEKVQKIARVIEKGLKGQALSNYIRATFNKEDLKIAAPLLNPLLKRTNALAEPKVQQAREYSGIQEYRHQPSTKKASNKKVTQQGRAFERLAKWTRQQMT